MLEVGIRAGTGGERCPINLNFVDGSETLDSRVTASGATNGTRISSTPAMIAKTAPRFNHDFATAAPKGLLIDGARENLLPESVDLSDAAWSQIAITVAAGDVASPTGAMDAWTLTNSGGTGMFYRNNTLSASVPYTFSVWLRRRTGTGNVGITDAGGAYTVLALTSEWQRFEVTTASAATTTIRTYLRVFTAGDEVDAFIPQLEQALFSSSDIFTTGSTVTRTADSLTMTGTDFSDWFTAGEGTFVVEFDSPAVGTCGILTLHDGTANEVIELYTSGTDLILSVIDGGAAQVALTIGTVTGGQSHKVAFAFAVNDIAACLDGGTVQTDTSATLPTVDRLGLGTTQAGDALFGHIKRMSYYLLAADDVAGLSA